MTARPSHWCMCIWRECDGFGTFRCTGCGGDLCICKCGGEADCPGCDECEPRDADDNEEPTR